MRKANDSLAAQLKLSKEEYRAIMLYAIATFGFLTFALYWLFIAAIGADALSQYAIGSLTRETSAVLFAVSSALVMLGNKIEKSEAKRNRFS